MSIPHTLVTTLTIACIAAGAADAPAAAQQVALEVRGSLPKAMGEFKDAGGIEATGDAGFGADLIFSVSPNLSLFGGWGQDGFGCQGCSDDDGVVSRGFEGGAKLILGPGDSVLPWLRVGVLVHQLHVDRGSLDATSDAGVGFQASAGLDLPLGDVLSFSPAVRYQQYQAEFDVLGDLLVAQEEVSYLTLDFGLHIHLGR